MLSFCNSTGDEYEIWQLGSQALLFTVLMALSHPAVAAPFTNGNFETPGGISFTGIGVGSGNTALLTGWTVGGPGGALQNADVFYQNSSFVGVMGISGDSSVGFGGNGSTGGTLSQTFDTVPGSNYTIDYFVTDQQGLGPQSFGPSFERRIGHQLGDRIGCANCVIQLDGRSPTRVYGYRRVDHSSVHRYE